MCETSASVKAKFDGANLSRDELNNFIGEMFLFYKGNLIVENISVNQQVFKATMHLVKQILKILLSFSRVIVIKTVKLFYRRHDADLH